MKKPIAIVGGLALGAAVFVSAGPCGLIPDLSLQAIAALAILITCIVWWVASVFPEFVTALIMCIAFVLLCQVPTETVFSAFASSTWWLLVAAFSLGFGMQKSGLMSRMAAAILRVFPRTFKMQAAGLIATGTLVGPFIPSLSAKAVMLAPLSLGISDSLGYERKGKQATGLFLAMFTGIRTVGPAVVSSSIIGYGLMATLPADVAAQFPMGTWFLCMLPWFIVVMIANYAAIVAIFSPKKKSALVISSEGSEAAEIEKSCVEGDAFDTHEYDDAFQASKMSRLTSLARHDVGGVASADSARHDEGGDAADADSARNDEAKTPMSAPEKRMAVIMVACVLLWLTEPLHGVSSHIVAIAAMVAMLVFKVVGAKDVMQGISWSSLVFIGCALGLADVFASLGIDEWIVASCAPALTALAANPYLFVIGLCLITIALRFVIVSEMAYINIFMAFMVPITLTLGISPWVVGVCIYAVVNPWFVLYQNPIYISAYYATEGVMAKQSTSAAYCALYMAICIVGLLVSVPLWQSLGLM